MKQLLSSRFEAAACFGGPRRWRLSTRTSGSVLDGHLSLDKVTPFCIFLMWFGPRFFFLETRPISFSGDRPLARRSSLRSTIHEFHATWRGTPSKKNARFSPVCRWSFCLCVVFLYSFSQKVFPYSLNQSRPPTSHYGSRIHRLFSCLPPPSISSVSEHGTPMLLPRARFFVWLTVITWVLSVPILSFLRSNVLFPLSM